MLVQLREEFSKWLMRTQNAGRVLRMPLLGVTAVSTLVTALKDTALSSYTLPIVAVAGLSAVVFIWAYDKFQVLNIQNRWNADRSDNYIGPTTAINQIVNARQLSVLSRSISEDWSDEKTRKEMNRITEKTLSEFRNGIDLGDFDAK